MPREHHCENTQKGKTSRSHWARDGLYDYYLSINVFKNIPFLAGINLRVVLIKSYTSNVFDNHYYWPKHFLLYSARFTFKGIENR